MSQGVRLVAGIVLLAVILACVAFALPGRIHVARSTVINAPEATVFPYVNDLPTAARWAPWSGKPPQAKYAAEGPDAGKGAILRWSGGKLPASGGEETIVASEQDTIVGLKVGFAHGQDGNATFRLDPSGTGTKVTWTYDAEVGNNPVARWSALKLAADLGGVFESGLARLRDLVQREAGPR